MSIQKILKQTKAAPELKNHQTAKKVVINFLLMISVVGAAFLAVTAKKRGAFLYQPSTKIDEKLDDFSNQTSQTMPRK